MSVKIYYAYRMPTKWFSPFFLQAFRTHCFDALAKHVRAQAGNKSPEAVREVLMRAKAASQLPVRSEHDIDCRLNVWFYLRHAYVVPIGDAWVHERFECESPVEDYAYWNNTDKPDDVTERAWTARGKMWETVCLDDWDRSRLVHTLVDVAKDIGVTEIARRIVKEKDVRKATWLR